MFINYSAQKVLVRRSFKRIFRSKN